MSGKRIFLAIDISDAARLACAAHIEDIRRTSAGVRIGWERPEKLHVTLKFLGETDAATLEKLQTQVARIATEIGHFKLRLSASGAFPSKQRPRILWIGVDDPSDAVGPIQTGIEDICEGLGFERERRPFKPHITIARIREPGRGVDFADLFVKKRIKPVEFQVSEIVIYESKLQPTGSIYSSVAYLPFLATKTES